MSVEDQRTAIGFSVALSGQLIAAALAMLAVEGAFVSYSLGNHEPLAGFVSLALLSGGCFVASIFLAGKGVVSARNAGFKGAWSLESGKRQFNAQAILCLVGLALFGVVLFRAGPSRQNQLELELSTLQDRMAIVKESLADRSSSLADLRGAVGELRSKVAELGERVRQLEAGKCTREKAE